jgi:prepilin-type N-terminal cleavage/methylation domain-containing protein
MIRPASHFPEQDRRPLGGLDSAVAAASIRVASSRVAASRVAAVRMAASRAAFTLVELMVVVVIVGMLASAVLFAMYGLLDEAKGDRTKTQIARIDRFIMDRWESFRTRQVRVRLPPNTTSNPQVLNQARLNAIRELMRLELPDRVTDVAADPVSGITLPTLARGYRRKCFLLLGPDPSNPSKPNYSQWSTSHEGSECLFLILTAMNEDGSSAAADSLAPSETGDTDGDKMLEVLDGWGKPIEFIRWAPGFFSDRQPFGIVTAPLSNPDDPFDPARVDPRWKNLTTPPGYCPFALYPLIFSAGPDGLYDINTGTVIYAATTPVANDPYAFMFPYVAGTEPVGVSIGGGSADNFHNHWVEVE